jgi:hypothetical protein
LAYRTGATSDPPLRIGHALAQATATKAERARLFTPREAARLYSKMLV